MIIDLKQSLKSGKDRAEFFFEYQPEQLSDEFEVVSVGFQGRYDILKGSVYVEGELNIRLRGACAKCLKDSETVITAPFKEEYLSGGGGEDNYGYSNDILDLRKGVDDAVILNLPPRVLCKEDCNGLCPKCGTDRNTKNCNCE